jgi:hypothetical protein
VGANWFKSYFDNCDLILQGSVCLSFNGSLSDDSAAAIDPLICIIEIQKLRTHGFHHWGKDKSCILFLAEIQ